MKDQPTIEEQIHELMLRMGEAAGEADPALVVAALQAMLLTVAMGMPQLRPTIRTGLRDHSAAVEALGEAVGDEAEAIVHRERARIEARTPASGTLH
jgi:hypothetical protein